MKAAVCKGFGERLVVEDVEIAAPAHGEVRVNIKACAICHSDIAYMRGDWASPLPSVWGHEAAGIVDATGPDVVDLQPGDPVLVTLVRHCGSCPSCQQGLAANCETSFALDDRSPLSTRSGQLIGQGLRTAAFAEQVLVDRSQLVRLPNSIPFASASLLACGAITGFGAVRRTASMTAGASAVVIGAGGVGLNAIQAASIGEAAMVIAVDVADAKLTLAATFGATHTIDSSTDDAVTAVRDITGARGADFVFVTVGATSAIETGLSMLATSGTLVVVGMPPTGARVRLDPSELAAAAQRIVGSKMGSVRLPDDVDHLIDLYHRRRLKLDELVSGTYSLDMINEAVADAVKGSSLRNVIVFDD